MPRSFRFGTVGAFATALVLLACGGSAPPAETGGEDPPPRQGSRGAATGVEPASSGKVQEGMDAIQASDFEKARAILTEAHETDPADSQAAFYLGVAHEGLKEFDAAKSMYEKAVAMDPKLADAYLNLSGIQLDVEKDAAAALETVDKGLAASPKHPGLLVNRALAIEVAGGEGLLEAYAAAVEAVPDNAEVRIAYADNLRRAGKKAEAVKQLMIVSESDEPILLIAASRLLGRLKEFDKCITVLDKAIAKRESGELYMFRGVCRHGKKDDLGAETDYKKAIELQPDLAPAHYYLGMHYCGAKKKKEGSAALKKAAEIGGDQGVGALAKKALAKCK